jgi:hypothetical protein
MENKDNNNEQHKSRRSLSRSGVEQESFVSTQSADSTFTSGSVVDLVMDEKATIMRSPEKTASIFFETRQLSGEDTLTAPKEPSERSSPRVSFSFPGAFRVSDAPQNDSQQQSVCIESVSSEESEESEVFVIPLASLVEDDKDVEAQNRINSVNDMPMAIAGERVVVDESAAAQPRRKSTPFRLSVVACLLLIAGILTGLSIALLKRRGRAEGALPNNNNNTALPTPLLPPPRLPPKDGSPNGGNSGGGNGGGGGDSGGGQGGGGGQRVLRTIVEFEAIDREFGLGNSIEN